MTSKVNLATHLVVGDSIAALALFEDFVHRQIREERLIGAKYVTLRIERINLDGTGNRRHSRHCDKASPSSLIVTVEKSVIVFRCALL